MLVIAADYKNVHMMNSINMNIFIINAHKYYSYSKGELNKFIFNLIVDYFKPYNEVETTIIENGYDIKTEIEKYLRSDIIIFQTPVNWYNIPWSFKKYIDDVYTPGSFYKKSDKYGKGGMLLNKMYMLSLTSAASLDEYTNTEGFFNIRSIDDIFIGFHKIHEYCGMEKLKTFAVYNVLYDINIEKIKSDLISHLKQNVNI